jgi:Tfp pilus assembly protein PilX
MKPSRNPVQPSRPDEHGFAIILTLIVITMMTVLVIGFNAATRTEQMAARNFGHQEQANQMAMLAVNKAVELLNEMPQSNLVTQPGRYYSPASGPKPLTSARFANGAKTTNINAWQQYKTNSYTNYFIATNTDPAAFTVPLIDVKNGANYIGRYGFWIDDDSSRINLNAAWTNSSDFLPTNARPLVFSTNTINSNTMPGFAASISSFTNLLKNFAFWVTNKASNDVGYGYFITPRQAAGLWMADSGNGSNNTFKGYNPMMFQVGAGPLNFRPSNSYALSSSNGVAAALDVTSGLLQSYGSAGYAGSLTNLSNALNVVASNYFQGKNYETYFGNSNGFAEKYGADVLRQIIANINDATLSASSGTTNLPFTGANSTDMLLFGNNSTTNTNLPVPSTVLGLRPQLFLNEVAVGVAFSTNSPATTAELQIWFRSELVDPYHALP